MNSVDHCTPVEFLRILHGESFSGVIGFWRKKTKKTYFATCEELEHRTQEMLEISEVDDVYFGVGRMEERPARGRGRSEDMTALSAFCLDIDIGTENHSSTDYPPTIDEGLSLLDGFPFQPTAIVNSGHGLHIYFAFDKPMIFSSAEHRREVANTSNAFQRHFIELARHKGYSLDNVGDLTRILRLPDTINHKGDGKKVVQILKLSHESRVNYEEVKSFLLSNTEYMSDYNKIQTVMVSDIGKKCNWLKHCNEDAAILKEPEWYHMLTVIARCENPELIAVMYSSAHPGYSREATMLKLKHATQSPGPITCQYVEENYFKTNANGKLEPYCKRCKYHQKIKSPIILGMKAREVESEPSATQNPLYQPWGDLLAGSSFWIDESGYLWQNLPEDTTRCLSNFVMKVDREIITDDGLETKRKFIISGLAEGGEELPSNEVDAGAFLDLKWIIKSYGIKLNIFPGFNFSDSVRSAIQVMSRTAPVETVFTHIGWRQIEGKWCYLHGDGCIGAENVSVAVDEFLKSYQLPPPCEEPWEAALASYNLLYIAPLKVTLPLFALVYLAPLTEAFRLADHECNFLLWLHGRTGTRKTSLATLFLSHFRTYSKSPPATFSDTGNALERKAFDCKDTIFLIDDYYPNGNDYDRKRQNQTANHLIRLYGDKIGKARMKADTSVRAGYRPRGLALVTGEMFIEGHSSVARCLSVEIASGEIDIEKLSESQANHSMLSMAMRGFIEWLQPQMEELPSILREEFLELRNTLLSEGRHGRLSETVAWLQIGYSMFLKYAVSIGLLEEEVIGETLDTSLEILTGCIDEMVTDMNEERPEILFIKTLNSMLDSKDYFLNGKDSEHLGSGKEFHPRGKNLGWEDRSYYYLIPEATFKAFCEEARRQSQPFPGSMKFLLKCLDEADLIKTEWEANTIRRTVKPSLGKVRKRVIQLNKKKMDELLGIAPEESEHMNRIFGEIPG